MSLPPATSIRYETSPQPREPAKTSAPCCPGCTASHPWPSVGCSELTRCPSPRRICPPTSTNFASASTAAAPVPQACCSTGHCSWPSATTRSATGSSSPTPNQNRSRRPRRADPGAESDPKNSAQMDSPEHAICYVAQARTREYLLENHSVSRRVAALVPRHEDAETFIK